MIKIFWDSENTHKQNTHKQINKQTPKTQRHKQTNTNHHTYIHTPHTTVQTTNIQI